MSLLDNLTKSLVDVYTQKLTEQEKELLVQCLEVIADDQRYNKYKNYFPEVGTYSRDKYPKHIEFFNAGKSYTERGFIAGNRVGKSDAGSFETVAHATGLYHEWWDGLRFKAPVLIWVGGDTAQTVRDIIQKKLVGEFTDIGSGFIPKDCIIDYKTRRNVPDAIEFIRVRHVSGGISTIMLKTYEQGRIAWQGDAVDFIWIDEECPQDVYNEALIRTMTTNGSIITTFTPLSGLTPLVQDMLAKDQFSEEKYPKHITKVGWKDVPHITEEVKEKILSATPPQLRQARSEGDPTVGSGLIYPASRDTYTIDDFKVPVHWQKLYGMDVGWNATACCWGAWNRDDDVIYIYSEYKCKGEMGEDMPLVHSSAIKARGEWINGEIDPASRGRSQIDGENLFMLYRKNGLKIAPANNAVESGIYKVWERLSSGRLKIFKSCTMLLSELSMYHRDEKGKIVKQNDHILDCLRYLCSADQHRWSYKKNETKTNVVQFNDYMRACI